MLWEQLAVTERTWFRMVEKDVIMADRHMSELPPIMSCFSFKHNLTIMGHGTANFAHNLAILSIPPPPAQSSQTPETGRTHKRTLAGWCTRVSVCFCSSQISHHSIDKNKQGRPGRLLKRLSVFRPLRRWGHALRPYTTAGTHTLFFFSLPSRPCS